MQSIVVDSYGDQQTSRATTNSRIQIHEVEWKGRNVASVFMKHSGGISGMYLTSYILFENISDHSRTFPSASASLSDPSTLQGPLFSCRSHLYILCSELSRSRSETERDARLQSGFRADRLASLPGLFPCYVRSVSSETDHSTAGLLLRTSESLARIPQLSYASASAKSLVAANRTCSELGISTTSLNVSSQDLLICFLSWLNPSGEVVLLVECL